MSCSECAPFNCLLQVAWSQSWCSDTRRSSKIVLQGCINPRHHHVFRAQTRRALGKPANTRCQPSTKGTTSQAALVHMHFVYLASCCLASRLQNKFRCGVCGAETSLPPRARHAPASGHQLRCRHLNPENPNCVHAATLCGAEFQPSLPARCTSQPEPASPPQVHEHKALTLAELPVPAALAGLYGLTLNMTQPPEGGTSFAYRGRTWWCALRACPLLQKPLRKGTDMTLCNALLRWEQRLRTCARQP